MPAPARRPSRDRFPLLLVVLAGALIALSGRLVWLQVIEAPAYAEKAADQRLRDIKITPKRGVIYDREGEPLATSFEARTVYAVPSAVKDRSGVATQLASVLGGDARDYEKRLSRKSSFVYIARKVELERAKRLEKLDIKGIGFLEDSKRVYPSEELACQVLGFVGVDDAGLAGIEKHYDELLAGKPGSVLAERDPYGRPIPGATQRSVDKIDGSDVVLTIDKDIQFQAQLELAETVKKFGAKTGSIVIMDPRNGEILAMASTPTFDPNDFRNADPKAITNKPVSWTYEPGSTMKPFTAAAVIDKGLFEADSEFDLPPTINVGGRTIHEAHDRPSVEYTLTEIIGNSSNVGAVKLGLALGKQGVYDYYSAFGFGVKTGVDFPGEPRGVMPAPGKWSNSSIGNIPFGQGMTATPLQLARALSAIADGGEAVTPHFLLDVPKGKTPVWPKQRVLKPESAAQMSSVLEYVVTDGTGGDAAVNGYRVAGKTGTAQVAKHGSYAKGAYVASFAGFLPADDPRVLIVVVVEEPTEAIYGGTVAAPVFSRLGQFTVDHLKIPPSEPTTPTKKPEKDSETSVRD